jgi:hypothetical protein
MQFLEVNIMAYADPWNPGWIRCHFLDANGNHRIISEQAPVLTMEGTDPLHKFPAEGLIPCRIIQQSVNEKNELIVKIDISKSEAVSPEEGLDIFDVRADQLHFFE